MSGKAAEGSDYTLSSADQVTIPAGQNSATVTLMALVDNKKEKKGEPVVMTLQPGAGYEFANANAKTGRKNKKSKVPAATVRIVD